MKLYKSLVNNKVDYGLYMESLQQRHFFHMVTASPWPFLSAFNGFVMVLGRLMYMHFFLGGGYIFIWGLCNLLFIVSLWLRDVIRESTFEGMHSSKVRTNIKFGFGLFIVSETMFFFGFFLAFFYVSLSPSVEIGCTWPSIGIEPINPWKLPLLNTMLLLLSGIFITILHMCIQRGVTKTGIVNIIEDEKMEKIDFEYVFYNGQSIQKYYFYTLICGFLFTAIQGYEYIQAPFTLADSVYGSTFYMLTGFHGVHVMAGSIFILVCWTRTVAGHFAQQRHVGLECAAWYWHFVDVVWLFLYISIYIWGSWGYF